MKKGFTLIELIVVIAILGILVSVILAGASSGSGDANYKISTDDGSYYVESYTKENNGQCVYMSEIETRYCGDWSVEKLNVEE